MGLVLDLALVGLWAVLGMALLILAFIGATALFGQLRLWWVRRYWRAR